MYQWEEKSSSDDDGNTTYSYEKVWSNEIIDSDFFNDFSHRNPTSMPYEKGEITANNVKVGEFYLSNSQIKNLSTNKHLEIPSTATIPVGYGVYGKYITNSMNMDDSKIGDIRISYSYNDYEEMSVLAVQNGNSFTDYKSSVGKTVNRVEEGILNSSKMISNIEKENKIMKWTMRLVGAVLIIFGYVLLLKPLTLLTSFIPILRNLVGAAINFVEFLVGIIHSLIVIAISWIWFRPLLGIALLGVVVGLIIILRKFIKSKANTNIDNSINQMNDFENMSNQTIQPNNQMKNQNVNMSQTNFQQEQNNINQMNETNFVNNNIQNDQNNNLM